MSEKEIFGWLKIDSYRKIVETIETTSKSAKEISQLTHMTIRDVGEALESLERNKVLMHTSNGWKATESGIKVLNKFFR